MKQPSRLAKTVPLFAGSLMTLLIVLLINRDFPNIGHDYRYFVSRMMDTNIHILLNGLSIQWYTPSFGGGLPAFPNPQNLEYSLVQWVSFFIGPWKAVLWSTAIISFTGYYYFYRLLDETLGLGWKTSTLGALFFLGNGFFIEHMIVGQLGYQLFPLSSIVLYILLDSRNRILPSSLVVAFLITATIHQAGFYLLVIFGISFIITFLILRLMRPALVDANRILRITVSGGSLALLMSASKIHAVFSLMQQFPRQVVDVFPVGLAQSFLGLVAQFFGVMTIAPIMIATGQDTDLLSGALSNITGAKYGIWETDMAISPVLLAFLFIELARWLMNIRNGSSGLKRPEPLILGLLLVSIWFLLELTFAKGLIFSFVKDLPILSSLHVNVRFASAFIIPLVVIGAFILERFFRERTQVGTFFILCFLSLSALSSYFLLSSGIHSREFQLPAVDKVQLLSPFRVTKISDIQDWDAFKEDASSFRIYEPLFGYDLENYAPEIHPGSVYEVDGEYFNMTNPVSLVFPELNSTYPFERIRVADRDKLEVFLQRGQPDWQIPRIQKVLNAFSLFSLVVCLGAMVSLTILDIRRKIRHSR